MCLFYDDKRYTLHAKRIVLFLTLLAENKIKNCILVSIAFTLRPACLICDLRS